MRPKFKEPVSGLSHLLGAFLGVWVLGWAAEMGWNRHGVAFGMFGTSLVLLYLSSSFYHLLVTGPRVGVLLRRLDHTMIFVLIAGSYTPYCLLALTGWVGWTMFGVVWGVALLGLLSKFFWLDAPRWLSTGLYLGMGWAALGVILPLYRALSAEGFFWLVAGGLAYTIGAVIYAVKRPDPFPPHFGFHEIWHLFVLAGSLFHVFSVATLR